MSILKISMAEEASLKFRFKKKIDKTRNYLLDQIKHNDLMSEKNKNDLTGEKYKKTSKYLNFFENFLILVSTVTGYISSFSCRYYESCRGVKICAIEITQLSIKTRKSMIK